MDLEDPEITDRQFEKIYGMTRKEAKELFSRTNMWDFPQVRDPDKPLHEQGATKDSVIFLNDNTVIVGQEHGKSLELSPETLKRVQAIAEKYGAWYEGNGMDREFTKGIIDDYQGSWDDDLLSPSIKGYPYPFLYVLFSNIKANDTVKGKIGSDPKVSIFDRILNTQPSTNYFPDRKFDAETLTKFLQSVSEGPYDFVKMSQAPATEKNVERFFQLGEKLMWPENWEEYPNKAGQLAKQVNDLRDKFLASRKSGVYVVGSGHLVAVQQITDKQDVAEEVNPQIFLPIFRQQEKIVTDKAGREYKLVAKPGPRELGQKFNSPSRLFTIEAYLLDRAVRVAWVNFVNHGEHLEAEDVVVEPKYRRRGLASAMYNFAKELGNDVKPSDKQTALGREFAAGYQYDKAKGMAEGAIKDLDIDLLDQQWDAIVGYVINGLEKNMDIGRIELNLYKYAGREMFDVDQALEDHGFESIADLADHIQQNNGRYVPPTFNLGEQDLAESLRIDVPNENWLQGKIDYAKKKGRDRFGAPYFNATTAYFTDDVRVPIQVLRKLPGMRGEQQNVRYDDLAAIKKILKDTGKLPLGRDGKEYVPFVMVAYNGESWVNEGNHRIMAAAELFDEGDTRFASLPVELKYFDGGERIKDGPLYPSKIGFDNQGVAEGPLNENQRDKSLYS